MFFEHINSSINIMFNLLCSIFGWRLLSNTFLYIIVNLFGVLFVVGGLIAVGAGFFIIPSIIRAKKRATRQMKVVELPIRPENVGKEIRVSGIVQPQTGSSPLISPLSMQPCVAWRLDILIPGVFAGRKVESAIHEILSSKEPFCIENKNGERVSVYQGQAHFVFIKLPTYRGAVTAEHINHFANALEQNGGGHILSQLTDIATQVSKGKIMESTLLPGTSVHAVGVLHREEGVYYLRPHVEDDAPVVPIVAISRQDLDEEWQRLLKNCFASMAIGVILIAVGVLIFRA